jgi:hypothetical protein
MSQLSWVTPPGNLANLFIGFSFTEALLAYNPDNSSDTISYQVIGGLLPTGLTLSSHGVLSGTPTTTDTYFTTKTYSFVVRATSAKGATPADQQFSIIITNNVNSDFSWVTPAGSLGTVPNGEFYQLPLEVTETSANVTTSFSFISGQLPPGMQVVKKGYLQGVPTLLNSIAVDTSETFRFTIRATNSLGHVRDRAFSLTITNVYGPTIQPKNSYLGSFFDGSYYQQQLVVNELNPNVSITWSNVGSLPPGIALSSTGLLSGYIQPNQLVGQFGPAGYDGSAQVSVITASALTANVVYQITSLGSTDFTLVGASINKIGQIFYATGAGTGTGTVSLYNILIPAGKFVTGINYQIQSVGTTDFTPIGATNNNLGTIFTATGPGTGTGSASQYIASGTELQEYDYSPYDFTEVNQSTSYNFTIRAFDGVNYNLQNYVLNVTARNSFSADNSQTTVDNTYLTTDSGNVYLPVILNANVSTLPTGRAGSYYAFKFDGYDFQNATLTYSIFNSIGTFDTQVVGYDNGFDYGGTGTNGSPTEDLNPIDQNRGGVGFDSYNSANVAISNLPGLLLDSHTGWLYGQLSTQSEAYKTYQFGVLVSKTVDGQTYYSNPDFVTLPVLGDVNNIIEWITPSNLGTIVNGSVSELAVKAVSIAGKDLVYTLLDKAYVPIRLPQGLELLPSGDISGRVSFEAFSIDDYATTFDNNTLTIDRVYNFTVQVSATDGSVSSTREFTVTLDVVDIEPYDNLYLRAMPAFDQRQIFNSVVSNTEIFVPSLIYRPEDPWFGIQKNIDMLFLPGLKPSELATYANAIIENHWTKTYNFGDVKTAVVLDENYQVKYEVIYIDVNDPELNSAGNGPALEINLTNTIANPYVDAAGNTFKIIYPNSSQNMIERLAEGVGYYDQSSLPEWMTSNQLGSSANKFSNPLGYTRAVVLAYTNPGASSLIAYRLRNAGINFNSIEFTVDRYLLDDFYTTNFDTATAGYILGRETTFDALPNQNIGTLSATVDYGIFGVPFDQISGRSVNYINSNGGLDGITNFQSGDTLAFVQQENFLNSGPYDGWISYVDAYSGGNITSGNNPGYDGEGFDEYTVIPGYLEKSQGISPVNQRGGVWKINIVNGIVNLIFVQEILPNQRIRVLFGNTYASAILYYNSILKIGQNVPAYSVYKLQYSTISRSARTTFNGNSTKFFSNRDTYYAPGTEDKYVKFPQYGAFN